MIRPFARLLGSSVLAAGLVLGSAPTGAQPASNPRPAAQQPAKPATSAKPAPSTPAKPAQSAAAPKPAASSPAAKPAPAAGPGGASATLVANFGDWGVYTAPAGRSKICYALTQPKDRLPKNLSRDPAYLFVSFRPAENVRNEVALVMGFPTRENGPAEASIGTAS